MVPATQPAAESEISEMKSPRVVNSLLKFDFVAPSG
jgi:hypothetical protein